LQEAGKNFEQGLWSTNLFGFHVSNYQTPASSVFDWHHNLFVVAKK
jgi:hypothetical protein